MGKKISLNLNKISNSSPSPPPSPRHCDLQSASICFQGLSGRLAYYYWVDFHFVSDTGGGGSRRQRAKHAQGGCSETGVSLSGAKQTHTGSRHGCHISLSSAVTPEGSGKGQPYHAGGEAGGRGELFLFEGQLRTAWEDSRSRRLLYTTTPTPQQHLPLPGYWNVFRRRKEANSFKAQIR